MTLARLSNGVSAIVFAACALKLASLALSMIAMAFDNGGNLPIPLTVSLWVGAGALAIFALRTGKIALGIGPSNEADAKGSTE